MKLVRFGAQGSERPGVLLSDDALLDLGDLVRDFDGAFFAAGGLAVVRDLVDNRRGREIGLQGLRLGAPIARPGNVVCAGLNYVDHARESGMALPTEPVLFNKAPNTVVGPDDGVIIPRGGDKTDWEVELGVVIGKTARYLDSPDDALAHVAGYAISNDVSERAFQLERGGQWMKGKSAETFNPLGPWLVTPEEVGDPQTLNLSLSLNGEMMQQGTTGDMVFGVAHLIWYISQFMVLAPGDLVNTGTPAGVGSGQNPQRFLMPGDVMEVTVQGMGSQRQVCSAAR